MLHTTSAGAITMSYEVYKIKQLLDSVSCRLKYSEIKLDRDFDTDMYMRRVDRLDKRKKGAVNDIIAILTLIKMEFNVDAQVVPDSMGDFKQRLIAQHQENIMFLLGKLDELLF